ncbi:piggyBac transposable element-derived protein 4-like [Perca fluviatilis]|uniref:piggyBac transposable element-derived protein 4-like n=1 Tax=Perca fluviatilis TaxID=8168 RepID=UPI001963AE5C|nr:piggyBac transposable element-derived protein 4-like [Perca fluviatilis]
MSDPDKDRDDDKKRGTPEHDGLFQVKPLMGDIQNACKALYLPRKVLAVNERMITTKAKTVKKAKRSKWGFKLFGLFDSSNGYTVDFSVYAGRHVGLSRTSVTSLVTRSCLGSGYHVHMDSFHTSPKLLRDLHAQHFAACGTYRDNRKDCPRNASNARDLTGGLGTALCFL